MPLWVKPEIIGSAGLKNIQFMIFITLFYFLDFLHFFRDFQDWDPRPPTTHKIGPKIRNLIFLRKFYSASASTWKSLGGSDRFGQLCGALSRRPLWGHHATVSSNGCRQRIFGNARERTEQYRQIHQRFEPALSRHFGICRRTGDHFGPDRIQRRPRRHQNRRGTQTAEKGWPISKERSQNESYFLYGYYCNNPLRTVNFKVPYEMTLFTPTYSFHISSIVRFFTLTDENFKKFLSFYWIFGRLVFIFAHFQVIISSFILNVNTLAVFEKTLVL